MINFQFHIDIGFTSDRLTSKMADTEITTVGLCYSFVRLVSRKMVSQI